MTITKEERVEMRSDSTYYDRVLDALEAAEDRAAKAEAASAAMRAEIERVVMMATRGVTGATWMLSRASISAEARAENNLRIVAEMSRALWFDVLGRAEPTAATPEQVADIERDQARADLERAQASAAAMREALELVETMSASEDVDPDDQLDRIGVQARRVLDATDLGVKVLEELTTLRAEAERLRADLTDWITAGSGLDVEVTTLRAENERLKRTTREPLADDEIGRLRAACTKAKAALVAARRELGNCEAHAAVHDEVINAIAALEAAEKGEVAT